MEWNRQLRGVFVLIAGQNKNYRLELIISLKGKLLVIVFIVVIVINLLYISWKPTVILSERTITRRLQKCNLRKNSKTGSVLRTIVRFELETPTQCLEYREIGINWENHRVPMWLGTELCKFFENKTQKGQAQLSLSGESDSNPMVVIAMYVRAVKSPGLVPEMLRNKHGNKVRLMAAAHCT